MKSVIHGSISWFVDRLAGAFDKNYKYKAGFFMYSFRWRMWWRTNIPYEKHSENRW